MYPLPTVPISLRVPSHHYHLTSKVSHPLLKRYVSALIVVSKMAPTEVGKAARVPPTQSLGHSKCGRTTSCAEDGRKPRREGREGSHRSARTSTLPDAQPCVTGSGGPTPNVRGRKGALLGHGCERRRPWGTVGRRERVSAEVGKTPSFWFGDL